MDLFRILSGVEQVDEDVYQRFDTRRQVFRHLSGLGKKVTAATLPALLSTMFTKAYGQTTTLAQPIIDTLNLALGLEYLEFYYYSQGVASGLFSSDNLTAITIIRDDEQGHINALRAVLGASAIADPTAAASAGADGGSASDSLPKSWILLLDGGGPAPAVTAPVYGAGFPATTYPAEDNVTQATVNVQTSTVAPTGLTITAAAASEAFDEPLDAATVKTIARNFKSATAPAYLFA